MRYLLFKALHIAGLILWIGPTTGGFYLIMRSKGEGPELWLRRAYMELLYIEALAFVLLLLTGIGMVYLRPYLWKRWLKVKVLIVGLLFLPLEAIQIYLYKVILIPAIESGRGLEAALSIIDGFNLIGIALLAITLPLVFYLAIYKPSARQSIRNH